MQDIYVHVNISDVHWGAGDPRDLYEEYEKGFLTDISKLKVLDILTISGDWYDHKLELSSRAAKTAMKAFVKTIEIARSINPDVVIRVLKGTYYHDGSQLENYTFYEEDPDVNLKIITSVCSEDIFPNFKVLYIPEEYVEDQDEYYAEWLDPKGDEYDLILGHGMIEDAIYLGEHQDSGFISKAAPIFRVEDLINVCCGIVVFGHVHTPLNIADVIFYTGSYSRTCHGEERAKGYSLIIHDTLTNSFEYGLIENKFTKNYKKFSLGSEFMLMECEEIIKTILQLKEVHNVDKLSLDIDVEGDSLSLANKSVITKFFAMEKDIKLSFNTSMKLKAEAADNDRLKEKYSFIFDRNLKFNVKVSAFTKETYSADDFLTTDDVDEILAEARRVTG